MAAGESKQNGLNWAMQLSQLRECLNEQPSDIAQPPSVLHIDVHEVLQPSQEHFVEQGRQHIIEDTEGMIGIWGPAGVGKTLLLKAINNSFETGNSLIPSSSNRGDLPFDFVIYMTALEDCSVQSIQSEIIQRLKMQDLRDSFTTQATRISMFLQDKSFLVLLDGLHDNLNLAAVGLPPLGNQCQLKRKVVITTRSRSLCDQMHVNRAMNVPSLKTNEALQLFQEYIGNDSPYCDPHIGALAKDLVEQLRALPSELIRIASAMHLEAVGIPYPLGSGAQHRRKVVLTTRSKTVCGQMDVRKEIKVVGLRDDEAWQLFQDKVGQETLSSSPRIEALAKELVEELKGLPLALITVGRAMYGKSNPKQWECAMHYMKQSCCGGDDQDLHMENTVFRRLMFSYDNLRNDTLRECLLTCSLYMARG